MSRWEFVSQRNRQKGRLDFEIFFGQMSRVALQRIRKSCINADSTLLVERCCNGFVD